MIGIMIHPFDLRTPTPKANPLVYHRFDQRACLEIVIDNCLKVAQAHRIIVLLPLEDLRAVTGNRYGAPALIEPERQGLGRRPHFHYYERDLLEGMYSAAVTHGLDVIVRVSGLAPLLQPWVLNEHLFFHRASLAEKAHRVEAEWFEDGSYFEVMPFWYLADQFINAEERIPSINYVYSPRSHVPRCNTSLLLSGPEQFELFEAFLANVERGHDLADLIEEFNGKSKRLPQ